VKTLLIIGFVLLGVVVIGREVRKWTREEAVMQELDQMLAEILGDCIEAYCDDCGRLIAQGTGSKKPEVSSAAYHHSEIWDHEVHVRSWVD
jgi:hypothetical protein